MALLDVSQILADPDFATSFDVLRNAETVDLTGMRQVVQAGFVGQSGVVVPVRVDIVRFPDSARMMGSIKIYTQFMLIVESPGYAADIINFAGKSYMVASIEDWSQFGAGYFCATCQLLPVSQ